MKRTLSMFVKDNLKLHKFHLDQVRQEINDLTQNVNTIKTDNKNNLEDRVPMDTISKIRSIVEQEPILNAYIASLDKRVQSLEKTLSPIAQT